MEELKYIIKELRKFREMEGLIYSDDAVLDCATRIFNSQNIQRENKEDPATQKQINLLKKKRIDIPENLTKKQASKLIDKIMK